MNRSPTGHINWELTSAKSLIKLTPAYETHSWSVKKVRCKLNRWCVYVNCFRRLGWRPWPVVYRLASARAHTHTYISIAVATHDRKLQSLISLLGSKTLVEWMSRITKGCDHIGWSPLRLKGDHLCWSPSWRGEAKHTLAICLKNYGKWRQPSVRMVRHCYTLILI